MITYLYHLFVAIDQLANALLFGYADETLSANQVVALLPVLEMP